MRRAQVAVVAGAVVATGCAVPPPAPAAPVTFDTAAVVLEQGDDSARMRVEVARSPAQQERGLAGRPSLDRDAGMLFLFTELHSGDDGFWMWRTAIPLDIAFFDGEGIVVRILRMDPCLSECVDDCPGYFPEVAYASALEVNRGWFDAHGIGVGARMSMVRGGGPAR